MARYHTVLVDYDDDLFDITPQTLDDMRETLAAVDADLAIGQRRSEEAVLDMARDADFVMVQSVRPLLTARVIAQLSQCRGIIRLGIGYDSVDVAAATEASIPVSNVTDWCTDEVAEHAMAHMFACARRLTPLHTAIADGGWERDAAVPAFRIRGKTLGVIGFGRTGRALAQRMSALGVTVLAYHPRQDAQTVAQHGAHKVPLDELLQRADFISLHVPLTEETHHMLDADAFAKMKDGVILVNTSRGAVIDETALVAALRAGKVHSAGLDVMEQEPLPVDSPLRAFGNVTFTSHIASYSVEAVETLYCFGARIAADLLSGNWVSTVVNPEVRPKAEARWGKYRDDPS